MRGVVFDFDGVLADSMPQHAESFRLVLAPLDIPVEDGRVYELEGMRSVSLIRQLASDVGRELRDDEAQRLADEKQRVFQELGVPRLYPGAAEAVAAAAGSPRALVTGTRRENLERILGGLSNQFDVLLAEDAYTHEKPDPEPYALAAQELGLEPSACIAVENAVLGLRSARAAGYGTLVALSTTMRGIDLAEADVVVPTHVELARVLRTMTAGDLTPPGPTPE